MIRKTQTLWFWLAVLVACFVMYGRFTTGMLPVGADLSLIFAPFFSLGWDGGLPLWNPYSLAGMPLYDNLQAELFYPLRWPFFFLKDWRTYFGPFHFIHHLAALAGMAILLLGMGFRKIPALAGALVFGCGGHLAGRIINPTIFYACAWLPLLLYGALDDRPARRWATTLAFAMILALGSPHLVLYGLVGHGLVFLCFSRFPLSSDSSPVKSVLCRRLKKLPLRIAHFIVAFLLICPVFVPGIVRSGQSIRTETKVEDNLADSVGFSEIIPIFLGGTGGGIHPEHNDKTCYVGSVALVLVLGLCFLRKSWRDGRFLCGVGLAATGLLFALGDNVGWQFLMPHIPGFRYLAGPPRALVLTAAGMGILTALALQNLSAEKTVRLSVAFLSAGAVCLALAVWRTWGLAAEGTAPFCDEWFRAWVAAPSSVGRAVFIWLDAGVGLVLAGLFAAFAIRRSGVLLPSLALVVFFQVYHFYPRVAPPMEPPSYFTAPSKMIFLKKEQMDPAMEPFRVVGYDALAYQNGDFNKFHKFQFLMPSLATLYGLEDIQGFDPLIPADYARLVEKTAGRAVFNDRIRNLDVARPDLSLFDFLGVRFLMGHPYNRRLTNLPQMVRPGSETAPVEAWDPEKAKGPVTHWLFVSIVDGARQPPPGTEIARLDVEAEEGSFSFPIRSGAETDHIRATNNNPLFVRQNNQSNLYSEWSTPVASPSLRYRMQSANYRGAVAFDRPLRVKRVTWRLTNPQFLLYVASQAYRLERPPRARDPWRLAWGNANDKAPVFEYTRVPNRAAIVTGYGNGRNADREREDGKSNSSPEQNNWDITIPEDDLNGETAGNVEWKDIRLNWMTLKADSPTTTGLLVLRDRWDPGWKAFVNGRPATLFRVNGYLRGVALPKGESDVRLVYRPRLFRGLSVVSILTLIGLAGWFLLGVRGWGLGVRDCISKIFA